MAEIHCVGITKYFEAVCALDDVSIDLPDGEVTCIVGDNGAGKSTLVKVLSGYHRPDRGEILIGDVSVRNLTPLKARELGIQVVHQNLALCENLSATANVMLGQEPIRFTLGPLRFIDGRRAEEIARRIVGAEVGVHLDGYDIPVERFSGGQRQAVAIGRALVKGDSLVMFDEPTAALGVRQTEAALKLVRRVAEGGVAVIMISHNLDDIFAVADRIVALRQGRKTLDTRLEETDRTEVVHAMAGI